MKYKTYLYIVFSITFFVLASSVAINFLVDPYGIFRSDFDSQRIEPNQHFIKMKYILNNPGKYNSFLFGSSRVGNIDVTKIPTDERFYNMTYSMGVPKEFLEDIKLMVASGVKISTLFIGLDEFSFRIDPQEHFDQPMRRPYPKNMVSFYISYLLKVPNYKIIKSSLRSEPSSYYDIYDTGRPLHPHIDAWIESNQEAHVNDPKFNIPAQSKGDRIRETLDELKAIKQIAIENNIRLILFINPIHRTTYLANNSKDLSEFKQGLAKISSYYDFSGPNSITSNNYYYYETAHYRPIVGDMIIARVFSQDINLTSIGFGVEVKHEP